MHHKLGISDRHRLQQEKQPPKKLNWVLWICWFKLPIRWIRNNLTYRGVWAFLVFSQGLIKVLWYKTHAVSVNDVAVEAPYSRNGRRNLKIHKDHEKKQDTTILLPAKKCNECRKSCRIAPLISCDFCPLFFHMDCLDPPLTSPPSGRWMCPNHVEHYLVSVVFSQVSLIDFAHRILNYLRRYQQRNELNCGISSVDLSIKMPSG